MSTFNFKPEFGNPNHLKIVEEIGKYEELVKRIKIKKSESKDIDRLEQEAWGLERTIKEMVEIANQK